MKTTVVTGKRLLLKDNNRLLKELIFPPPKGTNDLLRRGSNEPLTKILLLDLDH